MVLPGQRATAIWPAQSAGHQSLVGEDRPRPTGLLLNGGAVRNCKHPCARETTHCQGFRAIVWCQHRQWRIPPCGAPCHTVKSPPPVARPHIGHLPACARPCPLHSLFPLFRPCLPPAPLSPPCRRVPILRPPPLPAPSASQHVMTSRCTAPPTERASLVGCSLAHRWRSRHDTTARCCSRAPPRSSRW